MVEVSTVAGYHTDLGGLCNWARVSHYLETFQGCGDVKESIQTWETLLAPFSHFPHFAPIPLASPPLLFQPFPEFC